MQSTIMSTVKCRKIRKHTPNIIPVILQIIPEQSVLGAYVIARILGYNFSLGGPLGYSTVTFGKITNIPVTFYSSFNISFVIPVSLDLTVGIYKVQVVNIRSPVALYSNRVHYTLFSIPVPPPGPTGCSCPCSGVTGDRTKH